MTKIQSNTKRTILGWKIVVFTTIEGLGIVPDYTLEYGNSPVRDRTARMEKVQELMAEKKYFTMTPIFKDEVDEVVRKASGIPA